MKNFELLVIAAALMTGTTMAADLVIDEPNNMADPLAGVGFRCGKDAFGPVAFGSARTEASIEDGNNRRMDAGCNEARGSAHLMSPLG